MEGSKSNIIGELFGALWEVWKEMWGIFISIAPKALSFILWVLCGLIILPCVFIAGNFFNKWTDWGEKNF
jgi:hypothetical protein